MNLPVLARCMAIAFLPALSGFVTQPDQWYQNLEKPPLNPPSWVFAPVWTALYTLMGIAHYDYSTTPTDADKKRGHVFYTLQLLLNGTWSLAFFMQKSPRLALLNIVLLLIAIVLTMDSFRRVSKRSALLLVPYLAWVCFATYLNLEISRRNEI